MVKNKKQNISNKQLKNELSLLCLAYYFGKHAINSNKKVSLDEKLVNIELYRIVKLYNRSYNDTLNNAFKILDIIESKEKEKEKLTNPKNKFIKRLTFTDEGALEIDALLMCVALIFEYNELPNKHFHISKNIIDGLVEQYDGDYNKWFSNPRLLAAKFRETVSIYN